jgi:glycosyltransferase involved in cell wall biosynthesis
MRLDFLIVDLDYGGAERLVVDLAVRLQAKGYECRVISLMPPKAHLEELSRANISVCDLGMTSKWQLPIVIRSLVRLFNESPPSILHTHMFHANILGRVVGKLCSLKVLSSVHNSLEGSRYRYFLYRLTDSLCEFSTNVSASAVDSFVKLGAVPDRSRMRLLYNGIDTDKFLPAKVIASNKQFTWIAVGRLEAQKDYFTLLYAAKELSKSYDFTLKIVGDGSQRASIVECIEKLGIGGFVGLLGVRSDVPKLMASADGFVLSSYYEGFGLVVAEAMSAGLPVVVTESGGPEEIVGESGAGVVVPIRSPESLAESMSSLMISSDKEIKEMGQKGREYIVKNFSINAMVERCDSYYQEINP